MNSIEPPRIEQARRMTRRYFFGATMGGLATAAFASLLAEHQALGDDNPASFQGTTSGIPGLPHFLPKAKRVIYLFQSGAPSHLDLYDPKPGLETRRGEDLPDSIRKGQRLTGMTSGQKTFPVAPSRFRFFQHGKSGTWLSELLPHLGNVADELCVIRTLHTEAINHDPAITFITTGAQLAGRPSIGAWTSYGLGTENRDFPAFVVMISRGTGRPNDQPIYDRLWGSGFLPSTHQGVKFRSVGDPVLYLSNPPGVPPALRRRMLDDLARLNEKKFADFADPEISTRIAQYELAYRMQTSVPHLTDLADEPEHTFKLYGEEARKPGTFAANCLLARRLAERGVRFVQLFHMGWDHHERLPTGIAGQCRDVDQASAGLIQDLRQRGMLEDTLVIWGGEFGRTVYCQGKLAPDDYGRDHHPRCYSVWLAGGGIRPGMTYGVTDDYGYNIVENPVHVHDLNATIFHCLGIDHKRLTFKYQGRQHRLTDVHGEVVQPILA